MFQTTVLASGSKGNAILIRTAQTKLLLDAGLSGKRILGFLDEVGLNPLHIQGIILSHEHSDHSYGVGVMCRKLNIPLYATRSTFSVCSGKLGKLPVGVHHFEPGTTFSIRDLEIHPFSSSHDAVDSCNFTFTNPEGKKLAVVTDAGYPTKLMIEKIKCASTLILESNHDVKMLLDGPYPWDLKQRVRSRQGHLSNEQAVGVVNQVLHAEMKNLILAHLSETNNTPELARKSMEEFLSEIRHPVKLYVALQDRPTELVEV